MENLREKKVFWSFRVIALVVAILSEKSTSYTSFWLGKAFLTFKFSNCCEELHLWNKFRELKCSLRLKWDEAKSLTFDPRLRKMQSVADSDKIKHSEGKMLGTRTTRTFNKNKVYILRDQVVQETLPPIRFWLLFDIHRVEQRLNNFGSDFMGTFHRGSTSVRFTTSPAYITT